jgi:hypothetical protein
MVANPIQGDPTKPGSGFWVNNDMTDVIRERCGPRAFRHIAVFIALNWVMSDNRSRTFRVALSHLSLLSSLNASKIDRILSDLAAASVIEFEDGRLPGSIKVTMLGEVRL